MSLVKQLANKWGSESKANKEDLLLRYFKSSPFDVWLALQHLYTSTQAGVQDYLANRLHELSEEAVEQFLLQFVYLAVSRPGSALERTIVELCSKTFRVAIKTQWLLVALCQDHPKNKTLESFRERAYKAALEGKWEVPIRNPKLDPLSPYASNVLASPTFSPPFSPGTSLMLAPTMPPPLSMLPHSAAPQRHAVANGSYGGGAVGPQPAKHQQPLQHHSAGGNNGAQDSDYHSPTVSAATAVPLANAATVPAPMHSQSPFFHAHNHPPVVQPPGHIVMSPPSHGGPGSTLAAAAAAAGIMGSGTVLSNGSVGGASSAVGTGASERAAAVTAAANLLPVLPVALPGQQGQEGAGGGEQGLRLQHSSGGAGLTARKSGSLQIDLGCLLAPEQRGLSLSAGQGVVSRQGSMGGAAGPMSSTQPPMELPHVAAPPPRGPAGAAMLLAKPVVVAANGPVARAAQAAKGEELPLPPPRRSATGTSADSAGDPSKPGAAARAASAISAAAASAASNLAERIQSLRRELGEGEGVSALLERSAKNTAAGMVAAEDEGLMSDDEFGGRPMSPLTRLRYDTFGATLDFVDALCDASSALTNYSQDERHRALRVGLEHINREIEAANRRDVAIWFPMGRGGDRVLRLTAREAVLLNSREKAPFMLFVEVLEGQNECGDPYGAGLSPSLGGAGVDPIFTSGGGAVTAVHGCEGVSCVGGPAGGLAAGGPAPPPVVQFGRRETYGIALTGIGAQHQQQYMHSSYASSSTGAPSVSGGSHGQGHSIGSVSSPVGRQAGGGISAAADGASGSTGGGGGSGVGSTASGRASLPSQGGGTTTATTADTASLATSTFDTPSGLSPSVSMSPTQCRSDTGSPVPAGAGATACSGPACSGGHAHAHPLGVSNVHGSVAAHQHQHQQQQQQKEPAAWAPPQQYLLAAPVASYPSNSINYAGVLEEVAAARTASPAAAAPGGAVPAAAASPLHASTSSPTATVAGAEGDGTTGTSTSGPQALSGSAAAALLGVSLIRPPSAGPPSFGSGGGLPSPSVPPPGGAVVIPTRSASNSNIAAAALAATMAAAAANANAHAGTGMTSAGPSFASAASVMSAGSSGSLDTLGPLPGAPGSSMNASTPTAAAAAAAATALTRATDGGAPHGATTGPALHPPTPRAKSTSSGSAAATGLPPRPPPAPPPGGVSPINAAKEVSPHVTASGAGAGSVTASALLRRVMGDRSEDSAGAATGAAQGQAAAPGQPCSPSSHAPSGAVAFGSGVIGSGGSGSSSATGSFTRAGKAQEGASGVARSLCFSGAEAPGSPDAPARPDPAIAAAVAAAAVASYSQQQQQMAAQQLAQQHVQAQLPPIPPGSRPPPPPSLPPSGPGPLGHRGLSGGGGGQLSGSGGEAVQQQQQPAAATAAAGVMGGRELTEEEIAELMAAGCISPPPVKSDPTMASKLSGLLASLRGEAPMVRVRIRVLPQPPAQLPHFQPQSLKQQDPQPLAASVGGQAERPGAPADAGAGFGSVAPSLASSMHGGSGLCNGAGASSNLLPLEHAAALATNGDAAAGAGGDPSLAASGSFTLATLSALGGRAKAALTSSSSAAAAAPVSGPAAGPCPVSEDSAASGADSGLLDKSKALALLSRFGLCRKPAAEDDVDGSAVLAPAAATSAAAPGAGGGGAGSGGGSQMGPVGSRIGAGGGWPMGGSGYASRTPRLVQVSFEVAQGVNLAIPSPYRKSRRTPSHEAIEMLAGKYKIQHMPPPYECGPPLVPLPSYLMGAGAGGGSLSGSFSAVQEERPGEEAEAAAAPAAAASDGSGSVAGPEPSFSRRRTTNASTVINVSLSGSPATAPMDVTTAAAASPSGTTKLGFAIGGGVLASTGSPPTPTLQHRTPSTAAPTPPAASAPVGPSSSFLGPLGGRPGTPPSSADGPSSSGGGPSGLAASLKSSLTTMLSRASGADKDKDKPPSDPASHATNTPTTGASPRGGSPVRGGHSGLPSGPAGASSSSSSGAGRLARLINSVSSSGTEDRAAAAAVAASAAGRNIGGAAASALSAGGLPPAPAPSTSTSAAAAAAGVKVTDGKQERESLEERRRREAVAVYGERWAAKVKRIQRESPHGRRAGWALRCVIVKSGDDCRQELLALQLIKVFGDIFREAGLPLWVRPYEVLVTSNRTALIEMVPNTLSLHTIKSRSPPSTSLSDHFFAKFGRAGSPGCTAAQRRFTESLAAYSLICYLLQIKDRHNGNILLDDDGRIVHIDFGFLLSNSPGGVNFESAPFKLTRELLEVMDSNSDGRPSEMFDYFKVLMIQGFLAMRKQADRILLLTRMMHKSGFPCYKAGERAVKALEKRMQMTLTEVQCVAHVLQLIAESLDAWRTRQYDYYQRVLNGIL